MVARLRQWVFFIPSLVINLAGMVVQACLFYVMARFASSGAAPLLKEYGSRFEVYILLGIALNGFLAASLTAYYNAYAEGYWSNVFDVFVVHPLGVSSFMVASV